MLIPAWPKNVRRRAIRLVGMTYITGKVSRLDGRARAIELRFMVTLDNLGLMLNPLTRELLPMKLMLASLRRRAA